MKTFYVIALLMSFSAHAVFCSPFDGNWSTLSSSDINGYGYGQISGKGDYIWFKSDNGVIRVNVSTNEMINFNPDFSRLDFEEATFIPLDSENIALVSPRGISIFDGNSWRFISTPYESAGNTIDDSGTIWSLCKTDGIDGVYNKVYYYKNFKWTEAPFNSRFSGVINLINVDVNNRIWLTGDKGVYCYNKSTDSMYVFTSDRMKYTLRDLSGNAWFYNDSSLYAATHSGLIHKYRSNYTFRPDLLQIDSDGDIWFVSKDFSRQIFKVDLESSQIICNYPLPTDYSSGLHSSTGGVFIFTDSDLLYFKNNGTSASTIFIDSLVCSTCPNIVFPNIKSSLFRKNGAHIYTVDDLLSNTQLVERIGDKCSIIPLPSKESYIPSLYEKSDGTLIATICSTDCGLYNFNGSAWTLYPGTEGMKIYNLFENSKGKIWGLFEGKIIRQTQGGWELIDTSNSDLPHTIMYPTFGLSFAEDSEHAVWIVIDSTVARTIDGHKWTTYTHHGFNSVTYSNQNLLYKDQNNNVQLLWCDSVDGSTFVKRATFFDNEWHYEKILCPIQTKVYSFVTQDSRGIIYLKPFAGDSLLYYNSSSSNWVVLDMLATPYNLTEFLSDDNRGKIYFNDKLNQIVVFEYNKIKVNNSYTHAYKQGRFKARFQSSGKLAIDFKLDKPGNLSIGVYSPDGKLVKMLFNGFHPKGTFMNSYDLKCSRGMYIIQIKTVDKSMSSGMIIR